MSNSFEYRTAFSRNIGWITETEQAILRAKRVAIAGLGGVGGSHLVTLARLGIGRFNISDLDVFELVNFNRQTSARLKHVGRPKVDVLAELALDINPELNLRRFPEGIVQENVDDFLDGVDLYVDGLDFFAIDIRRAVFAACVQKGIPAITAAPLGMGVALLNFLPGRMTFEEYFRLEGQPEEEQLLRFLLGLSPAMLQMRYLVDDTRVDLNDHRGPSTPMACDLCAGMAATHALKVLLNRGKVPAAPRGVHFDAYRNKLAFTWRPRGNDNPLQKLGLSIARKRLSTAIRKASGKENWLPGSPIERILDLARWAPSGDNTQPWRFEIQDQNRFVIQGNDTRDWCVYDLDGRASQTAVGALLETIAIAASGEGMSAAFFRHTEAPDERPLIEVTLSPTNQDPDPLLPYVRARVTQRRSFSTKPLTLLQKEALEASVGPGFRVIWIEGWRPRWEMAKLLFRNARIRLTIPEAYEVHKRIIEWDAQFSEDRIPDQAVGLDPVALKLMKWAMQSWKRVQTLNRYLAGTWLPRIQLDLVPALRCGAHFVIVADEALTEIDDYLAGGRVVQRFWLTSAKLGLNFQPEMTPLIFSRYASAAKAFTTDPDGTVSARQLAADLRELANAEVDTSGVFMGRVGTGSTPRSRSTRLAVKELMNHQATGV